MLNQIEQLMVYRAENAMRKAQQSIDWARELVAEIEVALGEAS